MAARAGYSTRRWVANQVAPLRLVPHGLGILLDPDRLTDARELEDLGRIETTNEWLSLRRLYERSGRYLKPGERLVVLHQEVGVREERDLPFDISRRGQVLRIRAPGPPELAGLASSLPDDDLERVLDVARRQPADPVGAAVEVLAGVFLSDKSGPVDELRAAIRLATNPACEPLRTAVRNRLVLDAARALLAKPADPEPLQELWDSWVQEGSRSSSHAVLSALASELTLAHLGGLLRAAPASAQAELPTWTRIGTAIGGPRNRLDELFASPSDPWPPSTPDDWIGVARWWGEVRLALAEAPVNAVDVQTAASERWQEIHERFVPWLQERLGGFMSAAATWPRTIDRIPAMLARRLRADEASRLLLVVVDGMGFAQWARVRRELKVLEGGGVFTLVPTLTSICRQALLAGDLPLGFADTLETTSAERDRWRAFWRGEGFRDRVVLYARSPGGAKETPSRLEDVVVAAHVVTGFDGILHGTKMTGDRGVDAALRVWLDGGYLQRVIREATELGFEVWITSDHGNLECEGTGLVIEGSAVEEAGARVRAYATAPLRDQARARGEIWAGEPPGLPAGGPAWLFAPGRTAFKSELLSVAHGGFSLDEVIVPLAKVAC
jgi:PglZ domain